MTDPEDFLRNGDRLPHAHGFIASFTTSVRMAHKDLRKPTNSSFTTSGLSR